ncbi:MAG: GNAT family N-acetyltransferase [Clostridia bacterium]|nr:GNAT family N-acetyltransferase [Clostridia bacterium]
MRFTWCDYSENMAFVEAWLDAHAVRVTGMDDGWRDFYTYWKNEENTVLGENFWCKTVYENGEPFAAVGIGLCDGVFTVMELLISPEKRGEGRGTALLKELLSESVAVLGVEIEKAEAVIYPSNPASKRAFEKAGFVFDSMSEEGDVLYYSWNKNSDI